MAFGILVTIGVAWTLCCGGPSSCANRQQDWGDVGAWPPGTRADWPRPFERYLLRDTGSDQATLLSCRDFDPPSAPNYQSCTRSCGFPFLALQWRCWTESNKTPGGTTWKSAIVTEDHPRLAFLSKRRIPALPLLPVWPGFAADAALYAAAGWLVSRAPLALRRADRRRRRRCTGCGYPVGVSACCTECGHPLAGSQNHPPLPRWRRRAGVLGLCAAGAIAVVFLASLFGGVLWKPRDGLSFAVLRGHFIVGRCGLPWAYPGWATISARYPLRADFHTGTDGFVHNTYVPLWAPMLIVLIPTVLALRSSLIRAAPPPTDAPAPPQS